MPANLTDLLYLLLQVSSWKDPQQLLPWYGALAIIAIVLLAFFGLLVVVCFMDPYNRRVLAQRRAEYKKATQHYYLKMLSDLSFQWVPRNENEFL